MNVSWPEYYIVTLYVSLQIAIDIERSQSEEHLLPPAQPVLSKYTRMYFHGDRVASVAFSSLGAGLFWCGVVLMSVWHIYLNQMIVFMFWLSSSLV